MLIAGLGGILFGSLKAFGLEGDVFFRGRVVVVVGEIITDYYTTIGLLYNKKLHTS